MNLAQVETTAVGTTFLNPTAHFNKGADRYDQGCEKVKWLAPTLLVHKLQQFIDLKVTPLHVLDLGTGTAAVATAIIGINPEAEITGVDSSVRMLEKALEKNVLRQGICGDLEDFNGLKLPRNHFNLIVASGVFDFIRKTPQLSEGIVGALAKPGGIFAFTYEPAGNANPGVNTLQHDSEGLKNMFRRRGAVILADEPVPHIWENYKNNNPVTNHILIGRAP